MAASRLRIESSSGGSATSTLVSGDDDKRAAISRLISHLAETSRAEWSPRVLEECGPALLRGRLYEQTMASRLARAAGRDERDALERVDAFLLGYVGQERRRASRARVQDVLHAASKSAAAMDAELRHMSAAGEIDEDVREYIRGLVEQEERRRGGTGGGSVGAGSGNGVGVSGSGGGIGTDGEVPPLLSVLRVLRDRIEAEMKTRSRPEVAALAFALRFDDVSEMRAHLRTAFGSLAELDAFVRFVSNGVEYLSGSGVLLKSNMSPSTVEKMRVVLAEASKMRAEYLGNDCGPGSGGGAASSGIAGGGGGGSSGSGVEDWGD